MMKRLVPLCLILMAAATGWAQTEIPEKFQSRILEFAPDADTNEDGSLTTEELKAYYPSLPLQAQQMLNRRFPELKTSLSEAEEGETTETLSFKRPAGSPQEGREKGYNCLFLGHSYFVPIVMKIQQHAVALGLENHEQYIVASGGPKGSPGKLWANEQVSKPAKDLLKSGSVELVAMTAHYVGSEVEDYSRWVDLALEHNPKTVFVLQSPWAQKQEKDFTEYTQEIQSIMQTSGGLVEALRAKYPGVVFMRVAQAQWMSDLWRLYEDKQLPELTSLIAPSKGEAQASLFRDQHGHGGDLAVNEGVFLWLRVLYGIDLKSYDIPTMTAYDTKSLAQKITDDDPYAAFPQ
ncbi:MAG: hypothetical protein AAFY98_09350 [Verrucomicrobiota bacterium]